MALKRIYSFWKFLMNESQEHRRGGLQGDYALESGL